MENTVLKYVRGISENASSWEKRNHKKYGNLSNVCRQIEYDIKHGVTSEQVTAMLYRVRSDPTFSQLRKGDGSLQRLEEVESHFRNVRTVSKWNW